MSIKKVVILKPNLSLNFSESINVGINHSKNDKVFIANDDIIISKQTLERLADRCDRDTVTGPDSNCNYGWMTDKHYTVKGVPLVPAMLPEQIEGIVEDIYNIVPTKDNKPVETDWLAFFATMVHRKSFEDVGLLDENFVYDKEDLDWCVRAKERGKKFQYCFDSYCFHFGGISRKVKHEELGMRHLEDNAKNEEYFKNKYKQDKPVVGFYAHDAWEFWDETSLNGTVQDGKPKGIGGSETQAILLMREMAKLGYKIKIFNKCKEQHYDSGGYDVEYIPYQEFGQYSKTIKYNLFIASRYLDCFDIPFASDLNLAMIHDVFLIQGNRPQHDVHQDKIDKYLCLSNQHKQFVHQHHNIPLEKIVVTSNGLDFTRFEKEVAKDPYKMIYSSSPDRGLEVLLDLFPQVKAQVPETTLDIYYGFENFQNQEYVSKLMERINSTEGITYHGRVGQDVVAEAFQRSSIWAYPTWFEETYCITALEAMVGGSIVLSSDYWGLMDTVKDGGILLPMPEGKNTVFTQEYREKWIQECVKLLTDLEYQEYWREQGKTRVARFTWEAVAKQWSDYYQNRTWEEIQ